MKVFVTGVGGQLGYDVVRECLERGYKVTGSDVVPEWNAVEGVAYERLDITDRSAVTETLRRLSPDVVVHCAAWTAVDAAEDEENKPKVYAVNSDGTGNIAQACKELDCKLIYISTDYVFDGELRGFSAKTEITLSRLCCVSERNLTLCAW